MGEYAIRKSDGVEIKIGTCESMYYLRWDDRDQIRPKAGNVTGQENGLYFRLPFPDEDDIKPGDYENFRRGLRLYKKDDAPRRDGYYVDFSNPELAQNPGTIQFHHESGLLLNVPCYHGEKLPEVGEGMKAFWNGKSWSYELASVKTTPDGLVPIVHCRHCNQAWRFDWSDLWDYIPADMRKRFIERGYTTDPTATKAA